MKSISEELSGNIFLIKISFTVVSWSMVSRSETIDCYITSISLKTENVAEGPFFKYLVEAMSTVPVDVALLRRRCCRCEEQVYQTWHLFDANSVWKYIRAAGLKYSPR